MAVRSFNWAMGSAPTATRSNRDTDPIQFVSNRCRVDIECERDLGERVTGAVAARGFADVVVSHLATVHSSRDASRLEVCRDGSSMDADHKGEIGQCSSCLVLEDEMVDFEIGQATLHRSSGWV